MFTFFGFRYAKVESSVPVHPEDFTAIALSSAHEKKLQAETGYPKLNQLMHNAWWGQLSNFLDVPTDCPQRDERLGWTGDTPGVRIHGLLSCGLQGFLSEVHVGSAG